MVASSPLGEKGGKRKSARCWLTTFFSVADLTLSDSFLERAMDTHMSAAEDYYNEADEPVLRRDGPFLRPSPMARTTPSPRVGVVAPEQEAAVKDQVENSKASNMGEKPETPR